MMRSRDARGFTLVELLGVLSLISLLFLLATPAAIGAFRHSAEVQVERNLNTIRDALERHYLDLGYYPIRLGELERVGYLKSRAPFRSPVSRQWYFYAVDDNRTGAHPQNYALGDSENPPGPDFRLHRGGSLPKGRQPYTQRAWAWFVYNSYGLTLYETDDLTVLPDPETPLSLAAYRTSCMLGTTRQCDLTTN